jgi:hypothetical protein
MSKRTAAPAGEKGGLGTGDWRHQSQDGAGGRDRQFAGMQRRRSFDSEVRWGFAASIELRVDFFDAGTDAYMPPIRLMNAVGTVALGRNFIHLIRRLANLAWPCAMT